MLQLVQILGSILILVGFAATQSGALDPRSRRNLILNFVGSLTLAVLAAREQQWGFLLLEGTWAVISGAGLLRPRGDATPDGLTRRAVGSHDS